MDQTLIDFIKTIRKVLMHLRTLQEPAWYFRYYGDSISSLWTKCYKNRHSDVLPYISQRNYSKWMLLDCACKLNL